MIHRLSEMEL